MGEHGDSMTEINVCHDMFKDIYGYINNYADFKMMNNVLEDYQTQIKTCLQNDDFKKKTDFDVFEDIKKHMDKYVKIENIKLNNLKNKKTSLKEFAEAMEDLKELMQTDNTEKNETIEYIEKSKNEIKNIEEAIELIQTELKRYDNFIEFSKTGGQGKNPKPEDDDAHAPTKRTKRLVQPDRGEKTNDKF